MARKVRRPKPWCCHIEPGGCQRPAKWHIRWGRGPDDYTEACTDHVGTLLEEGKENHVYPIEMA